MSQKELFNVLFFKQNELEILTKDNIANSQIQNFVQKGCLAIQPIVGEVIFYSGNIGHAANISAYAKITSVHQAPLLKFGEALNFIDFLVGIETIPNKEEYETHYLLQNPNNAERLISAIKDLGHSIRFNR